MPPGNQGVADAMFAIRLTPDHTGKLRDGEGEA
jgi:hypothetical protein